jgi:hypothetical protein
VAKFLDAEQLKVVRGVLVRRDGGRALASRATVLAALRKRDPALEQRWLEREARVGSALRAALEDLHCKLGVHGAGVLDDGTKDDVCDGAWRDELRKVLEQALALPRNDPISLLEFLRAGGAGVVALRQALHVDGPFLQLLLSLSNGPATLFDPEPDLTTSQLRSLVRTYDPQWDLTWLDSQDVKMREALRNGAGTCLISSPNDSTK